MTTRYCTNCGAQQVEGAAFCPACGTPAAAAPPPQPAAYQPQPMPQQAPPYAPSPPQAGPPRGGMSNNTKIGIIVAVLAAIVIAYFVRENEREFQRNRRASQTPVAAGAPPAPAPAAPSQQGGAPAAPGQTAGAGGVPDDARARMRIIGRWSVTNCSAMVFFRIDGTTLATSGSASVDGTWTYQNRRLTVVEPEATTVLELISLDDREMVTETQGRQQRWRRC